jgi:nucleotide-binding universal stress UspA family protein
MTWRSILVPVFPRVPMEAQLAAARQLAERFGGRVEAMHVRPDPEAVFAGFPEALLTGPEERAAVLEAERRGEEAARAAFAAWSVAAGLAVDRRGGASARWSARVGDLGATLLPMARVSDVVVLNRPGLPHLATGQAFDAAVFDSGRPVMLVPPEVPATLFGPAVVAWNGSLQATRAVTGAMPLLRHARRVTVFHADEEDGRHSTAADLAATLGLHGIEADVVLAGGAGEGTAEAALFKVLEARAATLLVMGVYTRGPAREALLGGMTQAMLDRAAIPVVMAH